MIACRLLSLVVITYFFIRVMYMMSNVDSPLRSQP